MLRLGEQKKTAKVKNRVQSLERQITRVQTVTPCITPLVTRARERTLVNTRITISAAHETWHQQPVLTETMELAASSAITMQMESCKARHEWPWPVVGTQLVQSSISQTSRRQHHRHKSWKNSVRSWTILTFKGMPVPAPTVARLAE
jgi:hypothetical protein